ncbi:hypothetical protein B4U84_30160 [Westiellopsis prolifica IICB1]|nr:hypothetical protein B4U84_30160 [Westiellopsis prolifica IICB1]
MFINPARLESINELPKKETKPMLTTDQIEKLELSYNWILDVATSQEYLSLENNRQLDVALINIDRVLKDQSLNPDHHRNEYNTGIKVVMHVKKTPSNHKRLRSLVLDLAANTAQIAFIATVLMGLGTLFCYGVDRIEQSRGEQYQPTWKQQAKVFEGSAICSISLCLSSVVIGACLSGGEQDE